MRNTLNYSTLFNLGMHSFIIALYFIYVLVKQKILRKNQNKIPKAEFICDICGVVAHTKFNMMRHMKRKHIANKKITKKTRIRAQSKAKTLKGSFWKKRLAEKWVLDTSNDQISESEMLDLEVNDQELNDPIGINMNSNEGNHQRQMIETEIENMDLVFEDIVVHPEEISVLVELEDMDEAETPEIMEEADIPDIAEEVELSEVLSVKDAAVDTIMPLPDEIIMGNPASAVAEEGKRDLHCIAPKATYIKNL